jgi:hypothetical protein
VVGAKVVTWGLLLQTFLGDIGGGSAEHVREGVWWCVCGVEVIGVLRYVWVALSVVCVCRNEFMFY